MLLAQRPSEHREILGEHIDRAAVDGAPAGDDAVARHVLLLHAEIRAAMFDEHVELLERIAVEQQFDALAGGELAFGVLGVDAPLPAAEPRLLAAFVQAGENVFHRASPLKSRAAIARARNGRNRQGAASVGSICAAPGTAGVRPPVAGETPAVPGALPRGTPAGLRRTDESGKPTRNGARATRQTRQNVSAGNQK